MEMSTSVDYPKTKEVKIIITRDILRKDPFIAKEVEELLNSREKAAFRKDPVKSLLVPESRKLVVDANGQRTMDGNERKYADKYNFDVSDQRYIQDNFTKTWKWTEEYFGVTIKEVIMVPVKRKGCLFWKSPSMIEKENVEVVNSEKPNELINAFCSIKYQINGEQNPKTYYIPVGVGPFYARLTDFAWYAGRGVAGDSVYWRSLWNSVKGALSKSRTKNR